MEFLKLAVFIACLVTNSNGQSPGVCSITLTVPSDKLQEALSSLTTTREALERERQENANTKSIQEELRRMKDDQDDLKSHLLRRLDALDEKTAWCLSKGQQGAHPLGNRSAKIEEQLENQNVAPTAIQNLLMVARDCQQLYEQGQRLSGVSTIIIDGVKREAYCEQEIDGGGWLVFQRRYDGSVDFYRNWTDYKRGFGDQTGEFWFGNDALHLLTRNHNQKLKIELRFNDETKYADYATFAIRGESQNYKLTVTGYSGTTPPGDSFSVHSQSDFSTKDRDNDAWKGEHYAQRYRGAWWYKHSHASNLNGLYGSTDFGKGMNWFEWKYHFTSMTSTRMMIKQKP